MDVSRVTQVQSIPRQMEIQQPLCECYHAIVLFCLGDEPARDGDEQRLTMKLFPGRICTLHAKGAVLQAF